MTSFLTGAAIAVLLSVGMYVVMSTLYVPTEVRYAAENLHLTEPMIEAEVTPDRPISQ